MDRSTDVPLEIQKLSPALSSKLSTYALAAAAAGVSLLAIAQPAAAEIVYTPTNTDLGPGVILSIDVNNDGVNDFKFIHYAGAYRGWTQSIQVFPTASDGIGKLPDGFAAALTKGARVGPAGQFQEGGIAMLETLGYCCAPGYFRRVIGPWVNKQDHYLGVSFVLGDGVHYGWIRMSITMEVEAFGATITGYAYETIAGKAVAAGELSEKAGSLPERAPVAPASLGVLALGTPGMSLWRREDASLAAN